MKPLYGIAEIHDKDSDYRRAARQMEIAAQVARVIGNDPSEFLAGSGAINNLARKRTKKYGWKVRKSKLAVRTLKPQMFFCEGMSGGYDSFLESIGYDGDRFYLDKGNPEMIRLIEMDKEAESLDNRLNSVYELSKKLRPSNGRIETVREVAGKFREDYHDFTERYQTVLTSIDHLERERKYWLGKIVENYQEPSMIVAGRAHLVKENPDVGILGELLKEEGIELKVAVDEGNLSYILFEDPFTSRTWLRHPS